MSKVESFLTSCNQIWENLEVTKSGAETPEQINAFKSLCGEFFSHY